MCESYDVLQSSSGSASDITHTLNDYGGSMGAGIRKLTDEFFDRGREYGLQIGRRIGQREGFIKGSVVTTLAIGTVGVTILGVKKLVDYCYSKKQIDSIPSQVKKHKVTVPNTVEQPFSEDTVFNGKESLQTNQL